MRPPPPAMPPPSKWRDPLWHAYFVAALTGSVSVDCTNFAVDDAEKIADEAWRRHYAAPEPHVYPLLPGWPPVPGK